MPKRKCCTNAIQYTEGMTHSWINYQDGIAMADTVNEGLVTLKEGQYLHMPYDRQGNQDKLYVVDKDMFEGLWNVPKNIHKEML